MNQRKPEYIVGIFTMLARILLVLASLSPRGANADVVTDWNAAFRNAAQTDSAMSNPGWASRTLAMINGAMYDALQAIQRTHRPFHVDVHVPDASFDAAAAQASYRILSATYPNQIASFDDARAATLQSVVSGSAMAAGVQLGDLVAEEYLAWRADDGAETFVQYVPAGDSGRWRPDPLNPTQEAWGPAWGTVLPFTLSSATQFSVPPPPALASQEYADAVEEVRVLGAKDSELRTSDQTETTRFWAYDRRNMGPPPVLFNSVVSQIAQQQDNTVEENARLFALTSVALADAGIASWESKYNFDLWRPISAIREADKDGNPQTLADPDWIPLGAPSGGLAPDFTPPFPAYVSGHAAFGAALFQSLAHFYGTDDMSFTLASDELPGVVRHFDAFSQASLENARSRVYMGVHYNFDDIQGRALGRQVANWITDRHFATVPEPSAVRIAVQLASLLVASNLFSAFRARFQAVRPLSNSSDAQ